MSNIKYYKVTRGTLNHNNQDYYSNDILTAEHKEVKDALGVGSIVEIPEAHVPHELRIKPIVQPQAIAQQSNTIIDPLYSHALADLGHTHTLAVDPVILTEELLLSPAADSVANNLDTSDISGVANAAVRARGKQPKNPE